MQGIDINKKHGLDPPDYHSEEWREMIRTIVYVVAGEMRERGADPTVVAPADAWRMYRDRIEGSMAREAIRPPPGFAHFLQADGPGYRAFRGQWLALRLAGTTTSLEALSKERPGKWQGPDLREGIRGGRG